MLDLRRLRYFVAVAEALHFGRAAARLHMSQPPLSRQIQQLEREIGVLLFRRSKRRVELTDAGAYLLDQAREMLADAETLAVRTRRVESGETGRLTLGFISTVDYSILPGLLSAYRAAHPGVTLELRELTSDVQLRELHEGRIDAGMMLAPVDDTALAMKLDERSAVVALTHDPKLDDLALMEALKSRAFYVGALGSRANNAKRRERLREFDLSDEQISRLHGPIGLFIGSRTPPEIAVSILAEITAVKNGVDPERVATVAVAKAELDQTPACSNAT